MARLFANDTIGAGYKEQLQKEHNGSKWGSTGARYSGGDIEALIRRYNPRSALDYGCGKGTVAQTFVEVDWAEYDPGIPGKDVKPSGMYDLVTCTDVMEHVEAAHVPGVIKDLNKYTKTALFVDIACYPTGKLFGEGPYKGQDLHITLMEPEEWIELFETYSELQLLESRIIDKRSKGKRKKRLQLVYERV